MKHTRLLCGLLAMLLCILCLAACAKPDDTPTDVNTEEDETEAGGNATHDANGYELDSLPETLDFGNKEVNIGGR